MRPRHTHRQRRAHRPGLTSPDRCETSFHQSPIAASREATIRFGGDRRIPSSFANAENENAPGGKPPGGVRFSLGRSARRSPSKCRIRSVARACCRRTSRSRRHRRAMCCAACDVLVGRRSVSSKSLCNHAPASARRARTLLSKLARCKSGFANCNASCGILCIECGRVLFFACRLSSATLPRLRRRVAP